MTGGDYRVRVKRIALAGGIGAGKSTVTEWLRDLDFTVIDADEVARDVTAPGRPAFQALRDAFGDALLASDGTIDRAFLADVVFADESALRRLNLITHADIGVEISRRLAEATGTVFVALPLYRAEHRVAFDVDEVWALVVEPETAVARLVSGRGFSEAMARARLASQMSNDERIALADRVLWNEGSVDDLYRALDDLLHEAGIVRG